MIKTHIFKQQFCVFIYDDDDDDVVGYEKYFKKINTL